MFVENTTCQCNKYSLLMYGYELVHDLKTCVSNVKKDVCKYSGPPNKLPTDIVIMKTCLLVQTIE